MAYEECPVGACEERALRARVKRGLYEMHLAVLSGLLLRQLKIDVLSVLVVTDKLEVGEPQASGNQEPPPGGRKNSGRGKRTIVSAAPAGDENNFEPRETG